MHLIRFVTTFFFLILPTGVVRGQEWQIDNVMDQDPPLRLPDREPVFAEQLKPLWLQALAQPEMDMKRKAIESIVRAASREMPGLEETIPMIQEALAQPDNHPIVHLAAARALISLNATESAPMLWDYCQREGNRVNQWIEPALAEWDYVPARSVWLSRLTEESFLRQPLLLAINGLAAVGESKAIDPMLVLALDVQRPAEVRISSARAVAVLKPAGLEEIAAELAGETSAQGLLNRLVAASLIRHHDSGRARQLMLQLAVDEEPAVSAIALERLYELDPGLIVEISETVTSSPDANVRWWGARALVARPTIEIIARLGLMLDDPHPDVRQYVRRSLGELAQNDNFDAAVREAGVTMLATQQWRGLEQAAILLVQMDHKSSAGRLIELLNFDRPEVQVTTGWALRKLAIPETMQPMLDHAQQLADANQHFLSPRDGLVLQVSQIFQAFGEMKYLPADELMRRFIPKDSSHYESRSAAIWALGQLYADNPQDDLTLQFAQRLMDTSQMFPEHPKVRQMAGVSLGRMKAEKSMQALEITYQQEYPTTLIGQAAAWAINEMTGRGIPDPITIPRQVIGWFLEPLD